MLFRGLIAAVLAMTIAAGATTASANGAAAVDTAKTAAKSAAVPARTAIAAASSATRAFCIVSFDDDNGNGVKDAGSYEHDIFGWLFTVNGQTRTANQPNPACFPPMSPGTYAITESPVPGWLPTTPMTFTLTGAGPGPQIVMVGHQISHQLCIRDYNDLNGNHVWDAGEPRLSGRSFTVRDASNAVAGTTSAVMTDPPYFLTDFVDRVWGVPSSGNTGCLTLHGGTYSVREDGPLPTGWINSDPGGATPVKTVTFEDATFYLSQGSPGYNAFIDFGDRTRPTRAFDPSAAISASAAAQPRLAGLAVLHADSTICAQKYNDANGDGQRSPGEGVLAGWTFTLRRGDSTVGQATTDAAGLACFTIAGADLAPPYTLSETPQGGWTNTDPGGPTPRKTVAVLAEGATQTVLFGNRAIQPYQAGHVCVVKYYDLNGNRTHDSGEPTLAGWRFTLNGASQVTNDDGRACFDVKPGNYTVAETLQPGWISTDPGGATPQKTASVAAGQTVTLEFGNRKG